MFFPRLRAHAKWAFALMVLVFAGGFVFLGVGSGGVDIGQVFRDAFGNKGSSGTSLSDAREQVREHPRQAAGYRKLATALREKGRTDEAIDALTQYTTLKPKDAGALRELAELELSQATRYSQEAQIAYLAQQEANAGSTFGVSPTNKFGQALGSNPISNALSTKLNTQLQEASAKYRTAADRAVATYEKLAKLRPNDPHVLQSLAQTAETLRDTKTAVSAYRRLLKLDLDPATKALVRQRIKSLGGG